MEHGFFLNKYFFYRLTDTLIFLHFINMFTFASLWFAFAQNMSNFQFIEISIFIDSVTILTMCLLIKNAYSIIDERSNFINNHHLTVSKSLIKLFLFHWTGLRWNVNFPKQAVYTWTVSKRLRSTNAHEIVTTLYSIAISKLRYWFFLR